MVYGIIEVTNMLSIVIIGHNEANFIIRMLASLKNIDAKRIWVLDRCDDGSAELLEDCGEFYITTSDTLKGRQTSHSRNLGLSHCDKVSDVIFLDGDRFIVNGDLNIFHDYDKDISLMLLENDHRNLLDINESYGEVHNGFYSCGVFFKRNAINKVLEFQNGEFFKEDIQDVWGIEDTYLGDVCYHLELTCDINKDIRLNGEFERLEIDSLDVIERRFILRDKLNVKWS